MKIVRNSFLMHIHTFSYVNDFHIIWQEWDRAELRIQLNITNIRISLRMGQIQYFSEFLRMILSVCYSTVEKLLIYVHVIELMEKRFHRNLAYLDN